MKQRLFLGILLLLGARLLPFPLQFVALLVAGVLIFSHLWANNRGWQRWWPLSCWSLALVAVAVFQSQGGAHLFSRSVSAGLILAFLIGGLAPSLVSLLREGLRAIAAVFDGIATLRKLRRLEPPDRR